MATTTRKIETIKVSKPTGETLSSSVAVTEGNKTTTTFTYPDRSPRTFISGTGSYVAGGGAQGELTQQATGKTPEQTATENLAKAPSAQNKLIEMEAKALLEKQIKEKGQLIRDTAAQKAQEEAYIRTIKNNEELGRYISAKSKSNKERELQARAAVLEYYKSVLSGTPEEKAQHRLESVFSYSQYGINEQFNRDVQPTVKRTPEQEKELVQTLKTYGTSQTIFALTETNKRAELKRAAIEKEYEKNISAGMSVEKAQQRRDNLLSYEASKDVEFYNTKLNYGLFGGGSSGGKGAGGTWFSNEEYKNANWLERWDMKMKEAGLTGDLKPRNEDWPRYIFLPEKGQALGVTPEAAYTEFRKKLKTIEKEQGNLIYFNPILAAAAKNQTARTISYRTVQDRYTRLRNEPLSVEKELLLSYFEGVALGGIGGYMMSKGGPLAQTTFKGLSYVGAAGYVGLTGAKYVSYEAGLTGLPESQKATAPNAPNIIQDVSNIAAFSFGFKAAVKGQKVEQKQKQPLKTETRKLEYEVVENYPRQTITQRQKSTGRIEIKLNEVGFKQAEIKQFLTSKAYTRGEPVTITSYKPVQGSKAIGGIERGYFVKAGDTTSGFYIVKGKYRAIVDIGPSNTTLRYRDLKTGKLLDTKTIKTMESGLDVVESSFFKYQKNLVNKPGIRGTYRAEATQSLYSKRFKTDVKPITTTREELSFIKGLKSGQLTTTQPTYTTQRTGEVTADGIKWTGKKTIIDQSPKVEYALNEKLLPERYTAQVTKGGNVFFEKVKPGKVYGQVVYKQFGQGKGLITETVQGSKPVDVFFKMVKSKAGNLPITSQVQQPQTISVQAPQLQAPTSQFQTISTSVLKQMPRTDLKVTPVLISSLQQKQELNPKLRLFTPQINQTRQTPKIETISKIDVVQKIEPVVKTEQRPRQEQRTEQVQEVITQPINIEITKPTISRVQKTPEPKVPPPINAPFKFEKPEQKKGGMFKVLVRRRGQFRVIAQTRTEEAAINIGKTRVLGTAAASFKIEPNPTRSIVPNRLFYSSKKEPGVFIQKRQFRISSFGEKREIPGKALFLSRTKRAVRNIFGGL